MLQAIETVYQGYRFRSRLEARWAVFFDAMGYHWQYEVEGYQLPTAGRYLPDFVLPTWSLFCEIKKGEPLQAEIRKAHELAATSGQNVLMLCGTPGLPKTQDDGQWYRAIESYSYEGLLFVGDYETANKLARQDDFFGECDRLKSLVEFLRERVQEGAVSGEVPAFDGKQTTVEALISLDRTYYRNRYGKEHPRWGSEGLLMRPFLWCESDDEYVLSDASVQLYEEQKTPALVAAYARAKQARFEYGEDGAPQRA